MPLKTYEASPDSNGFISDWRSTDSKNSNRNPKGQLVLVSNDYFLIAGKNSYRGDKAMLGSLMKKAPSAGDYALGQDVLNAYHQRAHEEKCYSRMRRKLYQGSAALGITLATMKQSRDMIVNRYAFLNRRASTIAKDLLELERHGKGKRYAERLANFHLEVVFGWTPLITDIHAAATSVIQQSDQINFISVSSQGSDYVRREHSSPYSHSIVETATQCRVAFTAGVKIKNPNQWLAERAGMLNPGTVAWDMVPWSFVVNMFVNVNQLVQSVTDFAGLEFTSISKTATKKYKRSASTSFTDVGSASQHMSGIDKRRGPSGFPPVPSLSVRLPEANWGLAATAASLFTQRLGRLSGSIKPGSRPG